MTIISDIISFICNSDMKSNDYNKLNSIIRDDVPVTNLNDLKDFLAKKLANQLIDTLIEYLIDLGLISIIDYEENGAKKLIVPIFLLNETLNSEIV